MASVAAPVNPAVVRAQAHQLLQEGKSRILATFAHVPEDKLDWTPSPTAKSALGIVAHAAVTNFGLAGFLRGEPMNVSSFEELFAIMEVEERKITSRGQAVEAVKSSTEAVAMALDAFPDESVGADIGEGIFSGPAAFFMTLPGHHMGTHAAQIDYLETIWGDMAPHYEEPIGE